MGRLFTLSLEGKVYACKNCGTHLAQFDAVISKFLQCSESSANYVTSCPVWAFPFQTFKCRHGRGYLFHQVVNVTKGELEDRRMITGVHTVADIFCVRCGVIFGWTYEATDENSDQYKEGKSVLERSKLSIRDADGGVGGSPALSRSLESEGVAEVVVGQ